jgi:acetyl-CoA synthetase
VAFWAQKAREALDWIEDWEKDYEWDPPYYKWFVGGKLNACYNTIDRHVKTEKKDKEALIWVPEPPDEPAKVLTYQDLYRDVNKFAQ